MGEQTLDLNLVQTMAILYRYRFDLTGYTPQQLVHQWEQKYSALWIRLAVIEALYQGRYKSFSVEQILSHWLRQGKPSVHFGNDFERLICHKLPQITESSETSFLLENPPSMIPKTVSPSFNLSPKIEISKEKKTLPTKISTSGSKSITQFTPILDQSQSYAKLQEAAYSSLEEE